MRKEIVFVVLLLLLAVPTVQWLSGIALAWLSIRGLLLKKDFPFIGKWSETKRAIIWFLSAICLLSTVPIIMAIGALVLLVAAYGGL